MNLLISLQGIPPPKKNSRCLFSHKGKIFNIPSMRYRTWHRQVALALACYPKITDNIKEVFITFHMPDHRRRDLTNCAESLLDALVDNKIIADDCWQVIPKITLISAGVNKQYPHTEISIYGHAEIDDMG